MVIYLGGDGPIFHIVEREWNNRIGICGLDPFDGRRRTRQAYFLAPFVFISFLDFAQIHKPRFPTSDWVMTLAAIAVATIAHLFHLSSSLELDFSAIAAQRPRHIERVHDPMTVEA